MHREYDADEFSQTLSDTCSIHQGQGHCNSNDFLTCATPTLATCFDTADQCFIDFDLPRQLFSNGSNHCHAKTMQHHPSNTVTDAHRLFQCLGGQTIFRRGDVPGGIKPSGQWGSCLIKNRSGGNGTLMTTERTSQPTATVSPRLRGITTRRTHKAVAPPEALQIGDASGFIRKHFHKISVN